MITKTITKTNGQARNYENRKIIKYNKIYTPLSCGSIGEGNVPEKDDRRWNMTINNKDNNA